MPRFGQLTDKLAAGNNHCAATRFDRNIKTFMATIAIAAFVAWWI
ncbi:MAG: hypothetical protein ABGW87_07680 [Sphingomonadaceae bacterium]